MRYRYNIAKGPRVPVRGEDVYIPEEAAELFQVSRVTVMRWVEVGLVRGPQVRSGAPWRIRVREEDLKKLKPGDVGEDWLPLKGAALALGVSRQTILKKLKSGQLDGVRV